MIYQLIGSNLGALEILALVLAYMLALLISFSAHEFCHAFVAYKMGDPTAKALGRMSLNPFRHFDGIGFLCLIFFGFGWARPVEVNPGYFKNQKKGMALVSVAGVLANIVLAFVFSGIYYFAFSAISASTKLFFVFLDYFLYYTIILNVSLFVFNLIPIYPLDGFNFVKALLKPNNKFVDFMQRYGIFIMLIILIIPYFDYVFSYVTGGVLRLLFGFWRLF